MKQHKRQKEQKKKKKRQKEKNQTDSVYFLWRRYCRVDCNTEYRDTEESALFIAEGYTTLICGR